MEIRRRRGWFLVIMTVFVALAALTASATEPAAPAPAAPPAAAAHAAATTAASSPPSSPETIEDLLAGNRAYVADRLKARRYAERRQELVKGQHPKIVILSCADSRVPPEIIFNAGLGDLFVVRTAGNVADALALGSLEYGLEHLHAPLLVVLGHEGCGAVKASIAAAAAPPASKVAGNIDAIIDRILPAVRAEPRGDRTDDAYVAACVRRNLEFCLRDLMLRSAIIRELATEGRIEIYGLEYRLGSGKVEVTFDRNDTRKMLKALPPVLDYAVGTTPAAGGSTAGH